VDSPLDPDDDYATYRVACPVCNLAVWASHTPPEDSGENLLDGHDCAGPVEAEVEPGTNGAEGLPMSGGPVEPEVAPEPGLDAQDGTPSAEPLLIDAGTTTEGPEQ
jgi:hypothetical protein